MRNTLRIPSVIGHLAVLFFLSRIKGVTFFTRRRITREKNRYGVTQFSRGGTARGWFFSEARDAKLPHSVQADVRVAEGWFDSGMSRQGLKKKEKERNRTKQRKGDIERRRTKKGGRYSDWKKVREDTW